MIRFPDMRSISLDQLRALVEVVETGSFSVAARRLNLTQPAVSLQIRELERRLGLELVRRTGKQAHATAAGTDLIEHARAIFDQTDRALSAMRRHRDENRGRVHVGAGAAALSYLLLPVLRDLAATRPNIELAVTTGNTGEIVDLMLRNAIDLGFVGLPVDERLFDVTAVRDMRIVAILPEHAGDQPPDTVTPAYIAERPLIGANPRSNYGQISRRWLTAAGIEVRPAMEIADIESIKTVVSAGLGVSLVPEEAMRLGAPVSGVLVRPLDPPLAITLALIQRRNRPSDPATAIVHQAIARLADGRGPHRRHGPRKTAGTP
jgi:DNA-binding transcriptional LysR family regulator